MLIRSRGVNTLANRYFNSLEIKLLFSFTCCLRNHDNSKQVVNQEKAPALLILSIN